MSKGFFKLSEVQTKRTKQVGKNALCAKCKLFEGCHSPKMLPGGSGVLKLLHIAEAPGKQEDVQNEQLVGNSGQFYAEALRKFGIELNDGKKTNAVCCRPLKNKTPTLSQIKCCAPNVQKCIAEFKPKVIITLGGPAISSLLHHKFNKNIGGISKWQGFTIPDREYNAWICPTFHPSYIMRESTPEAAASIFYSDLGKAISMLDEPVPKFEKEENFVEILKHPGEVIKYLKHLVADKVFLTAFDYETTGLKPQQQEQKIKSCAISEGPFHVVAFPFFDNLKFIQTFRDYLTNKNIKKIAANIKYERDWSLVKAGVKLKGIFFDTMLGAHFINNRPGITSLEHYNYINFGLEPYDTHIKKFLKSGKGGNELNHIDKISLKDLLIYNGMDALTEFRNALVQMDIINIDYSSVWNGITGLELCPQYKGIINARKETKKKTSKNKVKSAGKKRGRRKKKKA